MGSTKAPYRQHRADPPRTGCAVLDLQLLERSSRPAVTRWGAEPRSMRARCTLCTALPVAAVMAVPAGRSMPPSLCDARPHADLWLLRSPHSRPTQRVRFEATFYFIKYDQDRISKNRARYYLRLGQADTAHAAQNSESQRRVREVVPHFLVGWGLPTLYPATPPTRLSRSAPAHLSQQLRLMLRLVQPQSLLPPATTALPSLQLAVG